VKRSFPQKEEEKIMNKVLVPNQHVFVRPSLSIFEVIFAVSFDKFGEKMDQN
jgi:hypothetical protein